MATAAPGIQFFHRQQLAQRLAQAALQVTATSAVGSGLFLAAPRRTGKSTFVREDLRPELASQGALVLYVDLWADRQADPGDVIVGAVRAELSKFEGVVTRLAKTAGMEKVTVGGMAFSLDRVGLGSDISLSAAFAALSDEVRKLIVLIIDEAQHASTTEKGLDALFALKAARDEVNSSLHHGLRIIATGSNRDKLAMLRASKDQAFFQAPMVSFPHLDAAYVEWFCQRVNLIGPLKDADVEMLFERASFRPEILTSAADVVRLDFEVQPEDVNTRFAEAVNEAILADRAQTMMVIHGLTPVQSAVLRVLAAHGPRYAPFEPTTIDVYRSVVKRVDTSFKGKLDATHVQAALAVLQERLLIWKEKRGIYTLEESTTADLLRQEGLLDAVPTLPAPPARP